MSFKLNKLLVHENISEIKSIIHESFIGLEKESLRINNSKISQSLHPIHIGSPLSNKFITTDFSEAQLEFITPPIMSKDNSCIEFLDDIHHFVTRNLGDESIWPFSMPPSLISENSIRIAEYGRSNLGFFKRVYRNGLANRYGKLMQTISGIHFNYSLAESIWESEIFKRTESIRKNFQSEIYLGMSRNILRSNWLLLYFLGASPIIPNCFLKNNTEKIYRLDDDTSYMPHATSLRMSNFGYQNLSRANISVSYNSLKEYISDLRLATSTNSQEFSKIPTLIDGHQAQLSNCLLQIEDEYYAVTRPKSSIDSDQRTTVKLAKGGINFIELRSIDLNPFSAIGIDNEAIKFLEIFLVHSFLSNSDPIQKNDMARISNNEMKVSKYGRDPMLYLNDGEKNIKLTDWANNLIDEMEFTANILDDRSGNYSKTLKSLRAKLKDPDTNLSARVLNTLTSRDKDYTKFGLELSEEYKSSYITKIPSKNKRWQMLQNESIESLRRQSRLEESLECSFEDYKKNYYMN